MENENQNSPIVKGIAAGLTLAVLVIVCIVLYRSITNLESSGPLLTKKSLPATLINDSTCHINLTDEMCVTLQENKDTLLILPVGCSLCYANFSKNDTIYIVKTNSPWKPVTEYSFRICYHDYFKRDFEHGRIIHDDEFMKDTQESYVKQLEKDLLVHREDICVKSYDTGCFVLYLTDKVTVSLNAKQDTLYISSVGVSRILSFKGSPLIEIVRMNTREPYEYFCVNYRDFYDRDFEHIVINQLE